MKIYLAGGWFNPEQLEEHTRIYKLLKKDKKNKVFNPKLNNLQNFNLTFLNNIVNIASCDVVVAITDFKDMGTLWETGYAYAMNKPIIYYAEKIDGKFNLMLAKTGYVASNEKELEKLLKTNLQFQTINYTYKGDIE